MKCQYCKKEFDENKIHQHHLHPKFMDNKKGNGRKIYLCEKCHNILHLIIPSIYWNLLDTKQKSNAKKTVIEFTKKWMGSK